MLESKILNSVIWTSFTLLTKPLPFPAQQKNLSADLKKSCRNCIVFQTNEADYNSKLTTKYTKNITFFLFIFLYVFEFYSKIFVSNNCERKRYSGSPKLQNQYRETSQHNISNEIELGYTT